MQIASFGANAELPTAATMYTSLPAVKIQQSEHGRGRLNYSRARGKRRTGYHDGERVRFAVAIEGENNIQPESAIALMNSISLLSADSFHLIKRKTPTSTGCRLYDRLSIASPISAHAVSPCTNGWSCTTRATRRTLRAHEFLRVAVAIIFANIRDFIPCFL